MGLDITAYCGLAPAPFDQDALDEGTLVQFFDNGDFPGRLRPLEEHPHTYSYADVLDFCAGSYSSYNAWREELAKLAGYPAVPYLYFGETRPCHAAACWNKADQCGPFYELINFTDCDGTIGTTACAKLAKDFAEFQAKADEHPDEYFRNKYTLWREAFEFASIDGAVDFH